MSYVKKHTGILAGKNVVVLMGGPGSEREVSLRSGAAVAEALAEAGAIVSTVDVFEPDFELPTETFLAFNMIHGIFGEDGQIQSHLDARGIPYTGEDAEGSFVAFDKILSKDRFAKANVPTAAWQILQSGDAADIDLPCVIKAPRQGSSVGVHIIHESDSLAHAIEDCLKYGDEILVEEFFAGRELTVGILGDTALPIIEIVPRDGFYDYEHKYTQGASEYFVPAPLTPEQTAAVQQAALAAHKSLGLQVYSRVDILLAEDGRLSVLEINTIPGMTATSLLPKAAAVVGLSFSELCEEIAGLSLQKTSLL